MKKLIALLFAVACVLPALAQMDQPRDSIEKYVLRIGQFDRLKVTDNVNVVYRCNPDSTGLAAYHAAPSFADAFIFTLNKSTLRVQVSTEDVGQPGLPTLYLYSDFLSYVENTSDFTVKIETLAPCPEFKAVEMGNGTVTVDNVRANKVIAVLNTGNGTVNISGECREAELRMVGTGLIQADLLKADVVKCGILGSGSIGCWPIETLNVKGIGSTKIYYKGEPTIKKTGGGKLFAIPQEQIGTGEITNGTADDEDNEEDEGEDDEYIPDETPSES